jgi:hypothetical protein
VENIWASTKTQPLLLFREIWPPWMFRILGLQILLYFHVSAIEFAGDKCFRAKLDSIRFDRSMDNI